MEIQLQMSYSYCKMHVIIKLCKSFSPSLHILLPFICMHLNVQAFLALSLCQFI